MNQTEREILTKIKVLYYVKRISNGLLTFFGAIIFIAILVLIFFQTYRLPILTIQNVDLDRYRAIRRLYDFIYAFLTSMIIAGIIGIISLTPITILISKKLKNLQLKFIHQSQKENKHHILFQKPSKRTVEPPKFF
jgi:hypothetical protein